MDEPLTLSFADQQVEVTAAFSSTPVALLGREDFFTRYRVTIDQRDQIFRLESYD